jgi:hypothetical protein
MLQHRLRLSFSIPEWDPYELALRHIKRVQSRNEPITHLALIAATVEPSVESTVR